MRGRTAGVAARPTSILLAVVVRLALGSVLAVGVTVAVRLAIALALACRSTTSDTPYWER
jgi:hypothetical protein